MNPWPPPDSERRVLAREAETKIWGAAVWDDGQWEWIDAASELYIVGSSGELRADRWLPWPED